MVEVSFLVAFLGGLLSLLSPCSALLLPAFFAYAFQSPRKLLVKTAIFYLGLATTLIPLGMGISAVSKLVYGEQNTLILVSGLVIVFFGLLQILGCGFEFGSLSRLRALPQAQPSLWAPYMGSRAFALAPYSGRFSPLPPPLEKRCGERRSSRPTLWVWPPPSSLWQPSGSASTLDVAPGCGAESSL